MNTSKNSPDPYTPLEKNILQQSIVRVEVSKNILFLFFALCCLFATLFYIRDFLLLIVLSILFAITFSPFLFRLQNLGLTRPIAISIIALVAIVVVAFFFLFLVPPIISELGSLSISLPKLEASILKNVPQIPILTGATQKILKTPIDSEKILDGVLSIGQTFMGGATYIILLLTFALYFLADGPRAYRWLLPYFSFDSQKKISSTTKELLDVVIAYISGQLLTSFLAALFTLILLSALSVPAALVLSIVAGIFDILPIVGFLFFIFIATLMALTVSSTTALTVFIAYSLYHLLENYYIIPKVYGVRLRLSGLVVMFGVIFGNLTAGIPGAIIMLPLLASYPIIERIWFARQVGKAAISEHSAE